jgi:hypothetical protein
MREAMFDKNTPGRNLLNPNCRIYHEIAKIAEVMRSTEPLRFGRMYFRQISGDGVHFGFPFGSDYTLAFSRLLCGREVLVAYNVSSQPRNDCIVIDAAFHSDGDALRLLYGKTGTTLAQTASDGTRFVQIGLDPRQFVILG